MSRLVESDVRDLSAALSSHDKDLRDVCGTGLAGIARNASGNALETRGVKVGIVPITAGLGIIGGFCSAVQGIVQFLGAEAFITEGTDVLGIRQAAEQACDILFTADDNTFIAVNLVGSKTSDNSEATGRGFAAALDLAAGGCRGQDVLVLGAGPVGLSAAATLRRRDANVTVYDLDAAKARAIREALPGVRVAESLPEALAAGALVLDATPAGAFLTPELLCADTILSAPGVPLGVSEQALPSVRLIHDVLEIGVATMLFDVL